jgi:hypothetical protein
MLNSQSSLNNKIIGYNTAMHYLPTKSLGSDFDNNSSSHNLPVHHGHGLSQSSFKTDTKANNSNPFSGPKLHLFKKSRRLKTSSAARMAQD